jgi:hypothetical protein
VAHAAALACAGIPESRAHVLQALTLATTPKVESRRFTWYTDVNEFRSVATGIPRMSGSTAQVRALYTLGRQRLSDRQTLDELARLFPVAESVDVQRAIAAVFIRSDYQLLDKAEFVRVLSQFRLKSPSGDDIIDILIRRLRPA